MIDRLTFLLLVLAALAVATGCAKKEPAAAPGAPAKSGGAGRAAAAGGRGAQKQVVEVTNVERRDLVETLTVVGSLAANESAEIRAELSGLVREIRFDEGQPVKKGQVLVKIDDSELRAQFAQVEARFKLAGLNVARSENLGESRSISLSEVDRVRSEFAATKAELDVLRTRLEKTEVKAPFDGMVGARVVSPGDYVNTATPITTLDDLSRLKVDFQVPERFLGKVEPGTTFVVRSRALGTTDEVRGRVYFVSSIIDRNTRSSEVKGFLEKTPEALKPGMFANIDLVLAVRRRVLTVPEGSILISSNGSQIIAVRENGGDSVADFINVGLGLRAKGLVEITPIEGTLAENQPVVASGVGALILYPGAKLDPRPLRAEFRVGE